MSNLMPFSPPIQQAWEQGALTVRQAWCLDLLLLMNWEPSKADLLHLTWVNLVNCPVELLMRH